MQEKNTKCKSVTVVFFFFFADRVRHCDRPRTKIEKWWADLWHTRVADAHQVHQTVQELSRWCHSTDFSTTQPSSTCTARTSHHKYVHLTGLRDTVDNSRSIPGAQKDFSEHTVGILADLFPVDDEKVAWLCLVAGDGRHTFSLVPNWLSSQDRRFARIFFLERASELAKEWKTPLFLAPLDRKKAFDHIQHSFQLSILATSFLRLSFFGFSSSHDTVLKSQLLDRAFPCFGYVIPVTFLCMPAESVVRVFWLLTRQTHSVFLVPVSSPVFCRNSHTLPPVAE